MGLSVLLVLGVMIGRKRKLGQEERGQFTYWLHVRPK